MFKENILCISSRLKCRVKNRRHTEAENTCVIPIIQLIIRMQIILNPQGYQLLILRFTPARYPNKKIHPPPWRRYFCHFSRPTFFLSPLRTRLFFSPLSTEKSSIFRTRMSTVKRPEHFARDAFRGSFGRPRAGFYLSARTRAARRGSKGGRGGSWIVWLSPRGSMRVARRHSCNGRQFPWIVFPHKCVRTAFPLFERVIGETRCCLSSRSSLWLEAHLPLHRDKREKGRVKGRKSRCLLVFRHDFYPDATSFCPEF